MKTSAEKWVAIIEDLREIKKVGHGQCQYCSMYMNILDSGVGNSARRVNNPCVMCPLHKKHCGLYYVNNSDIGIFYKNSTFKKWSEKMDECIDIAEKLKEAICMEDSK